MNPSSRLPYPPLPRLLLAVVPVACASLTGALFTAPNIPTWYAGLTKPSFAPPNWLFGPAWAVLYLMMAASLWRLLSRPPGTPGRAGAIATFIVQLVLNAAWTPAFFGLHSPAAGLAVILALLGTILATIRRAWPVDRAAALLLVPYAAWVTFATVLNAAILRLNA